MALEVGSRLGHGEIAARTILDTERLRLREMTLADLDFVAEMLGDPGVMRYYPTPLTRDEAQAWVDRQRRRYAAEGHGLWLVARRETDQPVGQVGLISQQVEGQPELELGYLIHRPWWRHGFAFEAARAVLDYACRVVTAQRVISLIRPENTPSQGVAQKLNMAVDREVDFRGFRHLVFVGHAS